MASKTTYGPNFRPKPDPRQRFEDEILRAANKTLNQTKETPVAIPEPPRIVCTKCPAVAVVHHWSDNGANQYQAWVECHGEHVFGTVIYYGPQPGRTKDVVITDINPYTAEAIHDMYERAEKAMEKAALQVQLYRAVLDQRPPTK